RARQWPDRARRATRWLPDAGDARAGTGTAAVLARLGDGAMRLGLILSEVGQGLRRNVSMVISIVLVTFISLTFVGTAILLQLQINQMKGYWYDRAQVAVYLCTEYVEGGNCNEVEATTE